MFFIKSAHSSVTIEFLDFSTMQSFIFIAQESSQYLGLNIYIYSLHKKDRFFCFCVYKNVLQENSFCI